MTAPTIPRLSLVVPTYNEAANIESLLGQVAEVLDQSGEVCEIIVVDDNSPDRTWEIAGRVAQTQPRTRVIRREGERGLSTAVVAGWRESQGEWLGVIDADLQHPPGVIRGLLDAMRSGADLAIASRHAEGGGVSTWSAWRRLLSRGAQFIGVLLVPASRQVSDPMSGYFIVRREIVDLKAFCPIGYKILLEVLVRCRPRRIIEVGYVFEERAEGSSKVTARLYGQYLRHLWRLRKASSGHG